MEKWIISSEEEEENNIEDMVGKSEELGVRSTKRCEGGEEEERGVRSEEE